MRYLIFDTETTGLPTNYNAPISDSENWPRMVQLAWQIHDEQGLLIENHNFIIKPENYTIPFNSAKIHGISTEKAIAEGKDLAKVIEIFQDQLTQDTIFIGHNIEFDINILGAEMFRKEFETDSFLKIPTIDTKDEGTNYCQIPGGRGGGFKWPTLSELHQKLFQNAFDEAHNAAADVNATARCFFELVRLEVISSQLTRFTPENFAAFKTHYPSVISPFDIEVENQVAAHKIKSKPVINLVDKEDLKTNIDSPFFHFHNHTSFSILSATTDVQRLIQRAVDENMPAVGITDMGNMMGSFHFISAAENINKEREKPIIPIVGCEVYISDRYQQTKFTKDNPDRRYPQVLLAKNKAGYHNLAKISSTGYTDGYYMGYPRVGKEVILQYKENLIATTGSTQSEIPNLILNTGETQAEETFVWWKEHFQDDFYVELIRHGLEEENHVNQVLLKFAKKYEVKVLAQNNTFYLDQKDAEAHDILMCVRDGEKKQTPIGRGRGFRFGFPNDEFYFKSQAQMEKLFEDIPEAISNFEEFIQKFEIYSLKSEVLLPKFDIPEEFIDPQDQIDGGVRGENAYLRHLSYEGAKERWGEITPEIKERLDFELETIQNTGYPGYFLIVQDFTSQARKMGVSVGPGRGSAAGSAVAYCVGITNIDPIKYDLLFERFLNPDRISLPDIDIDFDDRGRDKIIQWVVNKYGSSQVAQIITYGTMAGKSAVRDTSRVMDLNLSDSDRIAKKVHGKLNKIFHMDENQIKKSFHGDEANDIQELIKLSQESSLEGKMLQQAKVIEGSIRNTGVHACGVIITPTDIRELIPVAVAKEKKIDQEKSVNQIVTQFDNSVVENAGLLKMDFLGLKTLTIIMDAVDLIKETRGITLIPDNIPLDDQKTYKDIFQEGRTIGVFQYESVGMQSNLKLLKPDKFEDLIAMNALFRPGPIQYIPTFIDRKHGREKITYDLPEMEEFLAESYGVTIYQEQVMLLSQKLANFTKGEADTLRKAMGKKQLGPLAELEPKFKAQGQQNGHPEKVLDKIWKDWIAFTEYAFNKSHSTCYAYIAFQTAYLKAHYPAEFMAAVLSNNMNNIKQISFFMEDCKRSEIPVLSPDVNESNLFFNVNENGAIRFGLAAVKGVGENAVESIVKERRENGKFLGIFDFIQRVDLSQINKRTMENLILAGAFDEVDQYHRAQYFMKDEEGITTLEKIIKFGQATKAGGNESQFSLFGEEIMQETVHQPKVPECNPWPEVYKLNKEKEVVGVYISAHPLDQFKNEIKYFTNLELNKLNNNLGRLVGRNVKVCGIITEFREFTSNKDGSNFGVFTLNDYSDSFEFKVFGADYLRIKPFLETNQMILAHLQITENHWNKRLNINIRQVELLSEVLKTNANEITISMNLNELNDEIYEQLMRIIENHKGQHKLKIKFRDKANKSTFKADASLTRVEIQRSLLDELKKLKTVSYSLN